MDRLKPYFFTVIMLLLWHHGIGQNIRLALEGYTFRAYHWIDGSQIMKDSVSSPANDKTRKELTISFYKLIDKPLKGKCQIKYGIIFNDKKKVSDSLECGGLFEVKVKHKSMQFSIPKTVKPQHYDPCRGHSDYSDIIYSLFGNDKVFKLTEHSDGFTIYDSKANIWIKFKNDQKP